MVNWSNYNIDEFIDIIRKEIAKMFKKEQVPKCWYATVSAINNSIPQLTLAGSTQPLEGSVKNPYNHTLTINDTVVLFSPTGNLSNSVILFKF